MGPLESRDCPRTSRVVPALTRLAIAILIRSTHPVPPQLTRLIRRAGFNGGINDPLIISLTLVRFHVTKYSMIMRSFSKSMSGLFFYMFGLYFFT